MDQKTIGRYEIEEELGHGAMGAVYRAHDPLMGRTVAIKTILTSALEGAYATEYRARFEREARAAGSMSHPGIVTVYDVGEDNKNPYLVMEFVEGQTLSDALRQGTRFPLDRTSDIGRQVAEALGYAHRKGIIHRDIKPANIMLTKDEANGKERARIMDFGVAKLAGGEVTTTGQLLGTPAFMPPEQFTGAPIDGRTDIFALGVILYRMTTGEQPFPGETMTAVSYKVVHTEPVPPARLNPAVSPALETIILKCMAKDPAQRFQTGDELAAALASLALSVQATGVFATTLQAPLAGEATIAPHASLSRDPATVAAATTRPPAAKPVKAAAKAKPKWLLWALVGAAVVVMAGTAAIALVFLHPQRVDQPAQPTVAQQTPQPVPPAVQNPAPAEATSPAAASATSPSDAASAPAANSTPAKPTAQPPTSAGKPAANGKSSPGGKGAAQGKQAQPAQSAPAQPAAAAAVTPAPAPAPAPPPADVKPAPAPHQDAVGFNPKTLDAKSNARLKVDFGHTPAAFEVTVEMDGKLYVKGKVGDANAWNGLMAPPGNHEIRVVVSNGSSQKVSNTVGTSFPAKRRVTLKVEFRPEPHDWNTAFGNGTQLVASLKVDLFFL